MTSDLPPVFRLAQLTLLPRPVSLPLFGLSQLTVELLLLSSPPLFVPPPAVLALPAVSQLQAELLPVSVPLPFSLPLFGLSRLTVELLLLSSPPLFVPPPAVLALPALYRPKHFPTENRYLCCLRRLHGNLECRSAAREIGWVKAYCYLKRQTSRHPLFQSGQARHSKPLRPPHLPEFRASKHDVTHAILA